MMKRRNWFRYFALVTAVVLVAISLCGAANAGVAVNLDGKLLVFKDQAPCLINERTYIPVRGVSEALDAKVGWDEATQTATITKNQDVIKLTASTRTAMVNGKGIFLDAPVVLQGGRMMVPLRFVSETMGLKVDWNDAAQTVILSTPGYKAVAVASGGTTVSGPAVVSAASTALADEPTEPKDKRKVLERIQGKVPGSEITVSSSGELALKSSEVPEFCAYANGLADFLICIDSQLPSIRQYLEAALNEIDSKNAAKILTVYGKVVDGELAGGTFNIGGKEVTITKWAYHTEISFWGN